MAAMPAAEATKFMEHLIKKAQHHWRETKVKSLEGQKKIGGVFQVPELPYDKKLKRKRGSTDKSKTTKLKEKFHLEKGEGEIL